ncbi:unnamed protein product [Blepharisma stoltei]|uniref:Uncharacterized protein n=1 Tax=Blepharisma stoltei TaxID=1481888 RepID=A0AAU9IRL0_9CILI|nr:unnamed protein product [Blepharisma stoltei]
MINVYINQPKKNCNEKSSKTSISAKSSIKKYFLKKNYYRSKWKHHRFIYHNHSAHNPWEINEKSYKFDERSSLILEFYYSIRDRNFKFDEILASFYRQCEECIRTHGKLAKILYDYETKLTFNSYYKENKRFDKEEGKKIFQKNKREYIPMKNMKFLELISGIYKSFSNEML